MGVREKVGPGVTEPRALRLVCALGCGGEGERWHYEDVQGSRVSGTVEPTGQKHIWRPQAFLISHLHGGC